MVQCVHVAVYLAITITNSGVLILLQIVSMLFHSRHPPLFTLVPQTQKTSLFHKSFSS